MFRSKLVLIATLLSVFVMTFAVAFPAQAAKSSTIYDIASASADFEYLTAAVNAAGLAKTLDGKGQYTVFAPTDAAFEALPPGTVEFLLKPENKSALKNILLYHVARGSRYASDVVTSDKIRMMNKTFADITMKDGAYYIDNARIVVTDIRASNGVIHVIDAVIIP